MVDVNLRAIHLTKMNIKENKVNNCNAFVSNVYDISELADFVRCYNSAFLYLISEKKGAESINREKSCPELYGNVIS